MTSPVVSNAKYVVLGASGNTGSIVADFLLSKGEKVRVVGRDVGDAEPAQPGGGRRMGGDGRRRRRGGLEPRRMTDDVVAAVRQVGGGVGGGEPPRSGATGSRRAVVRRVEGESGDDDERMAGVGVDGDPLAGSRRAV